MNALEIIAQDLFDKVRSRFTNLQMGDESGAVTLDPKEARMFDFDFILEGNNLGRVSISINNIGSLKVFYSQGIVEGIDHVSAGLWYDFLKEMRGFAKRRLLRFDARDISKDFLDQNDFQFLAQNGSPQENAMQESNYYGSSMSSYRKLENTKLILRHSKAVDENVVGGRSRHVKAIFIENEAGERFKYPFIHLAGAKAMQRHVSNGGNPFDQAGQAITTMSEHIIKLGSFKRHVGNAQNLTTEAVGILDRASSKLSQLRSTMEAISKQKNYEAWRENLETTPLSQIEELDETTLADFKSKFTVSSFKDDLAQYFPLLNSIMHETSVVDLEDVVSEDSKKCCCDEKGEEECPVHGEQKAVKENTVDEGSAHGYNVVKWYEKHDGDQIKLCRWLKKEAGLPKDADVYFDDADLVYGDKTIVPDALINPKLKFNDLLTAVVHASGSGQAKQDMGGYYREGTIEAFESWTDELDPFSPAKLVRESGDQTPEEKHETMKYIVGLNKAIKAGEVQPTPELEQEFETTLGYLGLPFDQISKAWERVTGQSKDSGIDPKFKRSAPPMNIDGDEGDDDSDADLDKYKNMAKGGSIGMDKTDFGSGLDEESQADGQLPIKEIAEVVKSMFDPIAGAFPRGETGVKTHIAVKYGESAGDLAEQLCQYLIQKHSDNKQMEAIRRLSGLPPLTEAEKKKWVQDAVKGIKKGALSKQEGKKKGEKFSKSELKSLKKSGTPLEKKRANFALNIQKKK
jgi:hypothetical protein